MGHRFLIADDDESSRKGLKALLSSFGYAVEPAADAQEALEKSETSREVRLLRRRLQVDAQAQEILLAHPWRGNVRELRNTMERAFIRTLASVNNNKAGAARILGIGLKTLHNKLNRYGT